MERTKDALVLGRTAEAIAAYWGERCAEQDAGCPICDAWIEYDRAIYALRIADECITVPRLTD